MGGNRNNKPMHPDFYLPDFNIFVEYWGLVDVPDERKKEDYVKKMKWKMAQYYSQRIKFVSLYPSNLDNLEYVFPRKFEEISGIKFPTYPNRLDESTPLGSFVQCRYCNAVIRKGENYCAFCGKENP